MKYLSATIAVCLLICPAVCRTACCEVFILADGGLIEGRLLNPDQSPRKTYQIETKQGLHVTIDSQTVKKIIKPDDVEKKSSDEKATGKTPDEIMKERGYVRYKGRWRSPQEIKSIEKNKEREKAEKSWYINLRRWSSWLGGPKSDQAQKAIDEIKDPLATAALADALKSDPRRPARILYIEALARIGTTEALKTLAIHALENPDEETRLSCIDYLKKRKDPAVVKYFVARLGHKDNAIINRAAFALGKMGDPSAVAPLIDALVSTHKKKVVSGGPGQSAGFDNSGGGGMSMGQTTTIHTYHLRNPQVLDALVKLTDGQNVNFEYNVQRWRYWLAEQNKRKPLDARRD
ncbi:MAG: HEAT repeat domain-containing protein [Pirellulales bacterium]|nr:HEAT repeat domain-containing protein [Pirellulales bacterium]